MCSLGLQFIHISLLSKSSCFILSLHAKISFIGSAVMGYNVLVDLLVSWMALCTVIMVEIMHHIWPHLRILLKHTTDPVYSVCGNNCLACYKLAFLSDIFYRSREVCVVKNESVSIFEYENQAGV